MQANPPKTPSTSFGGAPGTCRQRSASSKTACAVPQERPAALPASNFPPATNNEATR